MIINLEYLQGLLPNLSFSDTSGIASYDLNNNDYVQKLIDVSEPKFLIEALGFSVYLELKDQFEPDGTWKTTALDKYKKLVDGDESLNWLGLRYELGTQKISMISNFVVCEFIMRLSQGDLTELGVSKSEVEQSKIMSGAPMHSTIWNDMIEMRQDDCFNKSVPITLYRYLRESNDFDTNNFKRYGYKNRLGL